MERHHDVKMYINKAYMITLPLMCWILVSIQQQIHCWIT